MQKFHQYIRVRHYEEDIERVRQDTDIFIISYLKAGRTWHRFLLGRYLMMSLGFPIAKVQKTAKLTSHMADALTR